MSVNIVEIVPQRLYWYSAANPPEYEPSTYYFSTDNDLVYERVSEYGPLNLSQIYSFCSQLDEIFTDPKYQTTTLIHYTSLNQVKQTNSVLLICAYQVLCLRYSPEKALQLFEKIIPELKPYHDALNYPYQCTLLDCMRSLQKAQQLGWFDLKTFDLERYYELMKYDISEIVPKKFFAFRGPRDEADDLTLPPFAYVEPFKKEGVQLVVRLNNSDSYNPQPLIDNKINHIDLFFEDGSIPPRNIANQFFALSERALEEKNNCPIAVHCRAGLGRTGTLIALYCIKNYKFTAEEIIAYIRMARPGSIHGPQMMYLQSYDKSIQMQRSYSNNIRISKVISYQNAKKIVEKRHSMDQEGFKNIPLITNLSMSNSFKTPLRGSQATKITAGTPVSRGSNSSLSPSKTPVNSENFRKTVQVSQKQNEISQAAGVQTNSSQNIYSSIITQFQNTASAKNLLQSRNLLRSNSISKKALSPKKKVTLLNNFSAAIKRYEHTPIKV
ncbi:hypothetical protein ABPG72_005431 [Tetrahymena utriculariae]